MLKKTSVVCCLIVFMLSFSFFTVNGEEKKGPRAFIEKSVFTFNPVPEGKDIMHDYLIENKGDSVLIIKRVKTG